MPATFYGTTEARRVQWQRARFINSSSSSSTNGASSGSLTTLYSFSPLTGGTNADGAKSLPPPLIVGFDGNPVRHHRGPAARAARGRSSRSRPPVRWSTFYTFSALGKRRQCSDGANPHAPLIQGNDGNFYGTATNGGRHGSGTVFQLVPNGASSTLNTLYSFTTLFAGDNADGANPVAGLTLGTAT